MANENTTSTDIATCSDSLRRLRKWLEDSHLDAAADDAYNAQITLHRVCRQHDASTKEKDRIIDALRRDIASEQSAAQTAKRLVQALQEKLDRQAATISEHHKTIHEMKQDLEAARSNAQADSPRKYREGYTAGVAACQARIEDQQVTIRSHTAAIRNFRRELDAARSNSQAQSNKRYQEGYAAGFAAGQEAARPPPPPPRPAIDLDTRFAWMTQLMLSNESSPQLSSNLKKAIVSGNRDTVASILNTQDAVIAPPALHLASLFGDIEIAQLLLAHHMDVNAQCRVNSDKPGSHVYGVTPMHLAVGAQHEEMITLLRKHGASFEARLSPEGRHTSAPPLWLISSRWLSMSGKDTPESVGDVLELMESLGWDPEAGLNKEGKNMKALVKGGYLGNRSDLKSAVLEFFEWYYDLRS